MVSSKKLDFWFYLILLVSFGFLERAFVFFVVCLGNQKMANTVLLQSIILHQFCLMLWREKIQQHSEKYCLSSIRVVLLIIQITFESSEIVFCLDSFRRQLFSSLKVCIIIKVISLIHLNTCILLPIFEYYLMTCFSFTIYIYIYVSIRVLVASRGRGRYRWNLLNFFVRNNS